MSPTRKRDRVVREPKAHRGRIAMLVHSYYPGDQRVRREAEALSEAGYHVDVICLRSVRGLKARVQPRWEQINGVLVHRLPLGKKRGSPFRYLFEYLAIIGMGAWKLGSLHLTHQLDAVHIHNMPDFLVVAGLPLKWMGVKLVIDIHDPMPEIFLGPGLSKKRTWIYALLVALQKWSCRQAQFVIAANPVLAEDLIDKRISPAKVSTVNNFPDPVHFPSLAALPEWPKNPDSPLLIFSGTLTSHYQLTDIVRALAFLKDKIPGIRLLIVGNGEDLDNILRLASSLSVKDRIAHHDRVDQKTLAQFIRSADVGISTHVGGPFGDLVFTQKILDYQYQGLPVVINRARTNLRLIPEETAFYYKSGDPEGLAAQVLTIWNDHDLVQSKREAAWRLALSYSWQKEKKKIVELYREILIAQKDASRYPKSA